MKGKMLAAFLMIGFCVIDAQAEAKFKKYDIKSGIVTYEEVMKISKMSIKNKYIVYFDDYGAKECREAYSEKGELTGVDFSDGKSLYSLDPGTKKASLKGDGYRGTELRVEWTEMGSDADRKSGKVKKAPARTIAGKSCEMIEVDNGSSVYGGWSKILMYMEVKSSVTNVVRTAVKVEENAKVSAEKFKIPAGYSK